MIRSIILYLALLTASFAAAQEVELLGTYGASFIGGETIEFNGRDSFYFHGFYCVNGVYGRGRCEIRGNFLYLFFEKAKQPPPPVVKPPVIIASPAASDSFITLQISCVDSTERPLPFVTILATPPKGPGASTSTNEYGEGYFRLRKSDAAHTLTTSQAGITSQPLHFTANADYTIRIYHHIETSLHKELNNGEVYVYEIDELSEDLILMRPKGSGERYRSYRRKE